MSEFEDLIVIFWILLDLSIVGLVAYGLYRFVTWLI